MSGREHVRPHPHGGRPTVTVVVPCYNYGQFLPEVVASVLAQERVEADVVVVDDCSTDDSLRVARDLEAHHDHVRVIAHETNRGHIQTYNDGLGAATGRYVALLSADDVLAPGALARAVDLMEARADVGLVYGYVHTFTGTPPARVPPPSTSWTVWPGHEWIRESATRGKCFIASPEVVMRRSVLERLGVYDPRLPHSGDLELWLRTATAWNVGRVNGTTQAYYRVHDSNMHLTRFAGMVSDLQERERAFEVFFSESGTDHPGLRPLHDAARRALARHALRVGLQWADTLGPDEASEFSAFAASVWPDVKREPLWHLFERYPGSGRVPPLRPLRALAVRTVLHLQWRRWRRTGI